MNDNIYDCFVDVFGRKPTEKELQLIGEDLPSEIVELANKWDWNDTEVGDKIFRWLKNRK